MNNAPRSNLHPKTPDVYIFHTDTRHRLTTPNPYTTTITRFASNPKCLQSILRALRCARQRNSSPSKRWQPKASAAGRSEMLAVPLSTTKRWLRRLRSGRRSGAAQRRATTQRGGWFVSPVLASSHGTLHRHRLHSSHSNLGPPILKKKKKAWGPFFISQEHLAHTCFSNERVANGRQLYVKKEEDCFEHVHIFCDVKKCFVVLTP